MKTIAKIIVATVVATIALTAQAKEQELKCVNKAVSGATLKNFKNYGASTNSCGIKLLHAGDFKETYIVCTSDETEPTEYIVVMDPNKKCKMDFIASTNESSTPTFDSDEGLLKSIECSIDNGDNKLVCSKE